MTSGSPSAGDSDSASTAETESVCDKNNASNRRSNGGSSEGIKHEVNIILADREKANDDVSSVSWKEDFGEIVEDGEGQDESVDRVEQEAVVTPDQLSEWETTGGKADVIAAFEGKMILDAPLKSVLEWAAPIVWKMFLRQAPLCSAAKQNPAQHAHTLAQNTPCPSFLPALLEKSMPRYSGMTASIAVTYALLYMYRIKFCFHCNGSTLSADAKSNTDSVSSNSNNTTPLVPPDSMDAMRQKSAKSFEKPTMLEPGLQCTLLFAVSMHLTSMWILDSCPGDRHYWKRYVRCIPTDRGVNWTRLVLFSGWRYSINVTLEDWLTFTATILQSYPFLHDSQREGAANGAAVQTQVA
ncbi:hypothetical protein CPB86DRAFT_715068 [Serendipita vermifera]|nr:hypothetical protein CPB86DRAFT_715068 [Serendipita vermifera]